MSQEMQGITSDLGDVESEKIVAHILIDPNSIADMDIETHNSVVSSIAQSIKEQNPSVHFDENACSLLEQTIAQTMAGNTQNIIIDTGTSLVPMEITIGHTTEEDNTAVQVSVSSSPEKSSIMDTSVSLAPSQSLYNDKEVRTGFDMNSISPRVGIAEHKVYICEVCGKAFGIKKSLSIHMSRVHTGEGFNPFACALCGTQFKIRKNWVKHMKKAHSIKCTDIKPNLYVPGTACKSKTCIRRKTNLKHQGIQTGCECKVSATKFHCSFCRPEKQHIPRLDDSECKCVEPYFVTEKTFSESATGIGCEKVDCTDCELCPKFEIYNNSPNYSSSIQCIECNIIFARTNQLRSHLKLVHGLGIDYQVYKFPNMTAFRKWKFDLERREMVSFIKMHGSKKLKAGLMHFYNCHRSGKHQVKAPNKTKHLMMDRKQGSWKLGIVCTSQIHATECSEGIIVKYWPEHYGHGKDSSFVQISAEEHAAIQDSVASGVPVESFLDDIRDNQAEYDHSQLYILKKKDTKYISNSYGTFEFNNGLNDAESTDLWVRTICQMEDSPVLFYKQELDNEEEFLLIIMTEFQKQILMAAGKEVICVDSLIRKRGNRFYLTVMSVMDECNIAFPVAFCISNKMSKETIQQFFMSIRDSTGFIDCAYFMSDQKSFYYEAWLEIMRGKPKWLWSLWYFQHELKLQLRSYQSTRRVEAFNILKVLMECQSETLFNALKTKFFKDLLNNPLPESLGSFVEKYCLNAEMWAQCHRKGFKASVNVHLEALHHAFRFACQERSKRRMDKFLLVIMKLVRRKMLDRLSRVLDEENINIALSAINMYHNLGLDISTENVTSLSNKIWLIQTDEEGDVYVACDMDMCPEGCKLKCNECDVCVHMYSCTCSGSLINANLCQHIHAVAWKFLVPHFSPPPSPDPFTEDGGSPSPLKPSEILDQVMTRAHDVYKRVREMKYSLPRNVLTNILGNLDDCLRMCDGKSKPKASHSMASFAQNENGFW